MCGRYLIVSSPAAIRALFGYPELPNFPPRYNVAPTQPIPIVRMWQGQRQFTLVRWGLLPPWVKDPKMFTLLINARADTMLDKPSFRPPMLRRRCLISADGFYEWKAGGAPKRPYAILPAAGGPIAFAGLWEVLDRSQRRGTRNRCDRHNRGKPHAAPCPSSHAGRDSAGGVRPVA